MAYRDWLIVIGVGVLVFSTGTLIVIRIRLCRRQGAYPVQVNDVSSTSDEPQRTYVLLKCPGHRGEEGLGETLTSR